jgi:nitrogen regulatory protein PII
MKFKHEAIFCIVNAGYSESVMETAKALGAGGGTVIHARGTASSEAEKLYEITVQPEKEIVMILVSTELKDSILTALYRSVGLNTPGQGIAFAMPVDAVVGLSKESALTDEPQEGTAKK